MTRLLRVLRNVLQHPLNQDRRAAALKTFLRWQVSSRLALGPMVVPFIGDTRLVAANGETSSTGNVYTGLYEFADASFLLHFLRAEDLFVDIGANVGVYTVLASGVIGARSISIEPIPATYARLQRHIRLNDLGERVSAHNVGLGRANDTLRFTTDLDCCNHIVGPGEDAANTTAVPVLPLDDVLAGQTPALMKIDVEGWESEVLAGSLHTLQSPSLLAIIIEMNSAESMSANERAVHEQLTRSGFAPYAYSPFHRSLQPLVSKNRSEGNTIYLRQLDAVQQRLQSAPPFTVAGRTI